MTRPRHGLFPPMWRRGGDLSRWSPGHESWLFHVYIVFNIIYIMRNLCLWQSGRPGAVFGLGLVNHLTESERDLAWNGKS